MKGSEKKKKAGKQAIKGKRKKNKRKHQYISVMLWCRGATGLKGPRGFVRFVKSFLGVRSVIARLVEEVF